MRRSLIVGAVVLGISLPVLAQDEFAGSSQFGAMGQKVIGADRLFGISSFEGKLEEAGDELKISGTSVSLLAGPPLTGDSEILTVNPFAVPRLTFDYFVTDNLSVGGTVAYFSVSGEAEADFGGTSSNVDLPETSGYVFAPRVGYVLPLSETAGVWLLGGLHYVKATTDDSEADFETTLTMTNISVQAMFYLTPVQGFAVTAGPVADIGISGEAEFSGGGSSETVDGKFRNFGLTAGVIGYF